MKFDVANIDEELKLDHEVEIVNFYEEDDVTGDKVINAEKEYSMTPIWGFIGIKLNI